MFFPTKEAIEKNLSVSDWVDKKRPQMTTSEETALMDEINAIDGEIANQIETRKTELSFEVKEKLENYPELDQVHELI